MDEKKVNYTQHSGAAWDWIKINKPDTWFFRIYSKDNVQFNMDFVNKLKEKYKHNSTEPFSKEQENIMTCVLIKAAYDLGKKEGLSKGKECVRQLLGLYID